MITERFYPPWSDGIVSYSKGMADVFLEASKSRSDIDITVLSSFHRKNFSALAGSGLSSLKTDKGNLKCYYSDANHFQSNAWALAKKLSNSKHFDVVHLLVPKLNPLLMRLIGRNDILLKQIFIYPFHSNFATERFIYQSMQKSQISSLLNIKFGFSTEIFKQLYDLEESQVLPPAINTDFFRPNIASGESFRLNIASPLKVGSMSQVLKKETVLLYMGPLLQERFNFKTIIRCFTRLRKEFQLDVGLMIVGRELGGTSTFYLDEIRNYINRNNMSDCVFACLKSLSETEKIRLFNEVDVLIYPFHRRLSGYSVVFPPIVLLEGMSSGLSVVSGGLPHLDNLIQDNENGIIVNNTIDESLLTDGIMRAIINKKRISSNARITIEENFSIRYVSRLYLDFLTRTGI